MTGMASKRLMAVDRGAGSAPLAPISHTYFVRNGSIWNVTDKKNIDLHGDLPVGNYIVQVNPMNGTFFLQESEPFTLPSKLYGDCLKNADRILRTFNDRSGSTGVLLSGEKGSGKTLLAKKLSIEAAKLGYPTIVINTPFSGDGFNQFLASISQPCLILFDEFEKVYRNNNDQQDALLTLLDGVVMGQKLFILTCNDVCSVNRHMHNRPSRLYYSIEYKGLDQAFIKEYCEDNLKNKDNINSVCQVSCIFSEFNFDMLKTIVEEMNRYNETAQEAMRLLNTKPERSNTQEFTVLTFIDGKPYQNSERSSHMNPLFNQNSFFIYLTDEDEDDDRPSESQRVVIGPQNLTAISKDGSEFLYKTRFDDTSDPALKKHEVVVILKKIVNVEFNYFNAL